MPDELLDALALLIMEVCDPLAGLVLEVRQQSGRVLEGVASLGGLVECLRERLDEGLQPRQHPLEHLGGDFRILQHFLQPRFVSPFHALLRFRPRP
jgi:hypothetical protein